MKSSSRNSENFEEYLKKIQGSKTPVKPQTIPEIIAEGNKIIESETVPTTENSSEKKKTVKPVLNESNPYVKARNEILKSMPSWRSREVLEMEKTDNKNNRYYEEFVVNVTTLGNKYSNL